MKKITTFFAVTLFSITTAFSQAPAASNAIMLQGFHWDSNAETSWTKLYEISGEIAGYFDYVWLPPAAASTGGTGYHPTQWSNQNSAWGSEAKQKQLIAYLKSKNCKAIADIVVNHRWNMSTWCDFYPDNFGITTPYGSSFQFTVKHIVGNDPMYSNPSAEAACRNNTDKGANKPSQYEMYGAARNLDHSNSYVRSAVKAYLYFMKNEMGYDGWRYDFAKGFAPSYFGEYNQAGGGEISVGEHFTYGHDQAWNQVMGWINGTAGSGEAYKSMAFDFPMKGAALIGSSLNYSNMAWSDNGTMRPAGLAHSPQSRRYAVTFVDNHDTYRESDKKFSGNIQQANAYILSSPGIPCIFYPHWRNAADRTAIENMMKARKAVGLHSESNVEVQTPAGNAYYKAFGVGTCGEMLTYIGGSSSSWDVPSGGGWTLNCSGTGWAIYTKITNTACGTAYTNKIANGVNPSPDPTFTSITLTAIVPASWTAPKIHVWAGTTQLTVGAWPGQAMTRVEGNKYKIDLSWATPVSEVGVVINNGTSSGTLQTIDLFASGSTCWELEATPTMGGKYNATVSATCQATSATNEVEAGKVSIYPNPVENTLNIDAEKEISQVTILSVSGQNIMVSNQNTIDISALSSGIYFLKIEFANSQVVFDKFLKK